MNLLCQGSYFDATWSCWKDSVCFIDFSNGLWTWGSSCYCSRLVVVEEPPYLKELTLFICLWLNAVARSLNLWLRMISIEIVLVFPPAPFIFCISLSGVFLKDGWEVWCLFLMRLVNYSGKANENHDGAKCHILINSTFL